REGRERHRLINGLVRRHFRQIMSQHSSDTSLSIAGRLEQRSGVTVSPQTIREACRSSNSITYLQHVQLAIGNYVPNLHGYSFIHDRTTWGHTNMIHNCMTANGIFCMNDYPLVSSELNAIESV
ncbi:unnamed protein product, partial [Rotaria sp. Silwood1]